MVDMKLKHDIKNKLCNINIILRALRKKNDFNENPNFQNSLNSLTDEIEDLSKLINKI